MQFDKERPCPMDEDNNPIYRTYYVVNGKYVDGNGNEVEPEELATPSKPGATPEKPS